MSPVGGGLGVTAGHQVLVAGVVEVVDGLGLRHHQGVGPGHYYRSVGAGPVSMLPVGILVRTPGGRGDQLLGLGVPLLVNVPDALGLGQTSGVVPVSLGVGVS